MPHHRCMPAGRYFPGRAASCPRNGLTTAWLQSPTATAPAAASTGPAGGSTATRVRSRLSQTSWHSEIALMPDLICVCMFNGYPTVLLPFSDCAVPRRRCVATCSLRLHARKVTCFFQTVQFGEDAVMPHAVCLCVLESENAGSSLYCTVVGALWHAACLSLPT